jgi:hypothetical protein
VTKISQLSSIGDSLAIGDQFLIRDIDDAGSPNKSVTVSGITRALADGDATAPALAFAADKNTGIYRAGTDSLAVATNGTERLRIDSSGGATFKGGSIFIEATSDTNNAQISLGRPSSSSAGYIRYINSENALAFRTNGSGEDVRIDSSGRLGIGTSAPSNLLHIASAPSTSTNLVAAAFARSTGANVGIGDYIRLGQGSFYGSEYTSADWGSSIIGAGHVTFYTGASSTPDSKTAKVRIDSSGRVGIGVTAPDSLLHVKNSTGDVRLTLESADGFQAYTNYSAQGSEFAIGYVRVSGSDTSFRFCAAGDLSSNERMRIDGSGRLLVGTSSGSNFVQIDTGTLGTSGTGATGAIYHITRRSGTALSLALENRGAGDTATPDGAGTQIGFYGYTGSTQSLMGIIACQADGQAVATGDGPGRLVFSTTADGAASPTERMRIGNKGNTTITSVADNDAALRVDSNGTSGTQYGIYIETGNDQNDATRTFLGCVGGATTRAQIRSNGGLANYQANDVNLSDINVKKDISPAGDTWDCVKQWEIVNYRYNDQSDDADLNLGVIAQQVAESCPEVITVFQEAKEATEDAPAQEERLGVKEQQMYWMAIKALQEAIARIETLETEVAALKGA